MRSSRRPVVALALLVSPATLLAQAPTPIAHWSFDEVSEGRVLDASSAVADELGGNQRLVAGVSGRALVLDGYTTRVVRQGGQGPELAGDFSVEAWIALGAYPWNWAPILAREGTISLASNRDESCWPEDIQPDSPRTGFFFGIGPQGQLGFHAGAGGWRVVQGEDALSLRTWVHVAAVHATGQGVTLYVDGDAVANQFFMEPIDQAPDEELRLGMPREQREPTNPVRAFATLACWYSLDGILDEVKLYDVALSSDQVARHARHPRPQGPALPPRVLPAGPSGPGTFGAAYTRLEYHPEYDALWPVASDPDVVVQFDDSPVRVVFWRGTRYGPAWVLENQLWMADQSIENFNGEDGCIEHMLDPRCRFSHVRIVESHDARVVVHWRYCPTAANGKHSQVDPVSGWEDWVDEYYTFYPDLVGVRHVVQHSQGRSLWPEEVIGLCQPGQRPEDVVELDAMTLASMQGTSHTYTWAETTPKIREGDEYLHFGRGPEERPTILRINMRSPSKPFRIFEPDNEVRIFGHEHRKGFSRFPWWNHWPVAMVPSDGRYCQAADRASHFSLAWGGPQPRRAEDGTWRWTWIYGASGGEVAELVPLARAWNLAPEAGLEGGGHAAWDRAQRCYVIEPQDPKQGVRLRIEASEASPLVNVPLLVKGWGTDGAGLRLDGNDVPRGRAFRYGHVRRVGSTDLSVWIVHRGDAPLEIELLPQAGD